MYRFLRCKKLNIILNFSNNIHINKNLLSIYIYKYISIKFVNFILQYQITIINENNLNLFYINNINYLLNEIYYLIK